MPEAIENANAGVVKNSNNVAAATHMLRRWRLCGETSTSSWAVSETTNAQIAAVSTPSVLIARTVETPNRTSKKTTASSITHSGLENPVSWTPALNAKPCPCASARA